MWTGLYDGWSKQILYIQKIWTKTTLDLLNLFWACWWDSNNCNNEFSASFRNGLVAFCLIVFIIFHVLNIIVYLDDESNQFAETNREQWLTSCWDDLLHDENKISLRNSFPWLTLFPSKWHDPLLIAQYSMHSSPVSDTTDDLIGWLQTACKISPLSFCRQYAPTVAYLV